MTKKLMLVAALIAAISIALVAGFTSFMTGREQIWSAEHATLSAPAQAAVTAAQLARNYFPMIALVLIVGIFGVAWLAGILFGHLINAKGKKS